MKKGQYHSIYLALFVLFGLFFLAFIFSFSNVIKKETGEEMNEFLLEDICDRIEKEITELRYINSQTELDFVVRELNIPKKVGGDTYSIIGVGNDLVLYTHGEKSILQSNQIKAWNVSLKGSAHSSNGKIKLNYSEPESEITLS